MQKESVFPVLKPTFDFDIGNTGSMFEYVFWFYRNKTNSDLENLVAVHFSKQNKNIKLWLKEFYLQKLYKMVECEVNLLPWI